jgi:hypothetical protein
MFYPVKRLEILDTIKMSYTLLSLTAFLDRILLDECPNIWVLHLLKPNFS